MSNSSIDERLAQLERGFADFRTLQGSRLDRLEYLVGELSDIARLHHQGMRIVQSDMQSTRADMQSMQSEIRGLQITANRILERLEQHVSDGHGG